MGFAQEIAREHAQPAEVTTDGGIGWRLRRLTTEELIRSGAASLALLAPPTSTIAEPAELGAGVPPEQLARAEGTIRALLAAAVYQVRGPEPEAPWEEIRLVLRPDDADPHAAPPRVHVDALRPDDVSALMVALGELYASGGLARALESFRAGSEPARPRRRDRAAVRSVAG
jgi:hypothetical protein